MRNLRKLGSLFLALVMCLALCVPALAATDDGHLTRETTLTIENAKKGVTYKVYKMADLSVSGEAYSYRLESDAAKAWTGFWASKTSWEYKVATGTTPAYIIWDEDVTSGAALAIAAREYVEDNNVSSVLDISVTEDEAEAGKLIRTLTGDGYYLVTSSLGFTSALNTAKNGELVITEKNVEPRIVQYIMDAYHDADNEDTGRLKSVTGPFGQEFGVLATIEIPEGQVDQSAPNGPPHNVPAPAVAPGYPIKNGTSLSSLKATFVIPNGLDFLGVDTYKGGHNVSATQNGGVPTLKIGVLHQSTDGHYGESSTSPVPTIYGGDSWADQSELFKVTETSAGFEVQFSVLFLSHYVAPGDRIALSYGVAINEDASVSDKDSFAPNTITASISYGDNNSIEGNSSMVDFYTLSLPVYKYANDNEASPLPDAKFTLEEDGYDDYVYLTQKNGKYLYDYDSDDSVITSGNDGYATIYGVGGSDYCSSYTLTETEAPAGYNKLSDPMSIVLNTKHESVACYPERSGEMEDKVPDRTGHVEFTINGNNENTATQIGVNNISGAQMPETGGQGVTMIIVAGFVLVAMAGTGYIVSRKRED